MRLRLPLHGVEDLHGVNDPLEDLGEGPLDQALEALLEALQHTHRFLLGFRGHDGIRTAHRRMHADRPARATLPGRLGQTSPSRAASGGGSSLSYTGWAVHAQWGSGGMADAHGSGPCARKGVRVQLPPSPPQTVGRRGNAPTAASASAAASSKIAVKALQSKR